MELDTSADPGPRWSADGRCKDHIPAVRIACSELLGFFNTLMNSRLVGRPRLLRNCALWSTLVHQRRIRPLPQECQLVLSQAR